MKTEVMKRMLIYGDSNVWGELALSGCRMPHNEQWPNILRKSLDRKWVVVQEGLAARVAGDYRTEQGKIHTNGRRYFEVIFRSATPVDVVIIALGTNDLKFKHGRSAQEIYDDLMWYKDEVGRQIENNEGIEAKVFFIAPHTFATSRDCNKGNPEGLKQLISLLKKRDDVIFLKSIDTAVDKVHFSVKGHKQTAEQVYEYLVQKGVV